MDISLILRDFITLLVVIDPIGSISVFLAATAGVEAAQRRMIAVRGVLIAAVILMFFLIIGQILLEAMEISLVSFQIAGSIVLFLFAITMIFGGTQSANDATKAPDPKQIAIFPIAIPSIAGPGAILAIVLLTDNHRFSFVDQAVTAALLCGVLLIVMVLLLLANPIHKIIGEGGSNIISKIMGMILAAVAVNMILDAFVEFGWINPLTLSAGA